MRSRHDSKTRLLGQGTRLGTGSCHAQTATGARASCPIVPTISQDAASFLQLLNRSTCYQLVFGISFSR